MTMPNINNKIKEQYKNGYCNAGKLLYLIDDNVLLGNNGYNALLNFKYRIGEHIIKDKLDIVLTGIFTKPDGNSERKFYNIHCNKCGWDGIISESAINYDSGCSCCINKKVVKGINDIATTSPWAIPYFENKKDSERYHEGSNYTVNMICPTCGKKHSDILIRNFFKNTYHLNCCSESYKSYPERFIHNLLRQLNIDFIPQANKESLKWCKDYRYDFYIPMELCIIETHGIQHYQNSFKKLDNTVLEKVQENDKAKMSLANKNGIKNYIILDCRNSNMKWIKDSVMSSDLPSLFNFNEKDVDWELCDLNSRTDMQKDMCNLYMQNYDMSVHDIANQFGVCLSTAKDALKIGVDLGICDYDSHSIREKLNQKQINRLIALYKNDQLFHIFTSCGQIKKYFETLNMIVSENKINNRIKSNYDLENGYYVVELKDVKSYSQYLNFMSNLENYSFSTTKSLDFVFVA